MLVDGVTYRTIWVAEDGLTVEIIDQTKLPHRFETVKLKSVEDVVRAIKVMQIRGAPLIGATAGYGMALAMRSDASDVAARAASELLMNTRPTAVNLRWALDEMTNFLLRLPEGERLDAAYQRAAEICDDDVVHAWNDEK